MQNVKQGDPVSAKGWNEFIRQFSDPDISAGGMLDVNNGVGNGGRHILPNEEPNDTFIGKIVAAGPASEADWTDNRYWVQVEKISPNAFTSGGGTPTLTLGRLRTQWADASVIPTICGILTATNSAEDDRQTHALAVGAIVHVTIEPDTGSPQCARYHFSQPPDDVLASIAGNAGTFGSPLKYSWVEVVANGTGGFTTKTGGRSGTTSTNFAQSLYELNGGQPIAPITNGTVVKLKCYSDSSHVPYWQFDLLQLPALAKYQGWYGTITGGATVTTIIPDYARCS